MVCGSDEVTGGQTEDVADVADLICRFVEVYVGVIEFGLTDKDVVADAEVRRSAETDVDDFCVRWDAFQRFDDVCAAYACDNDVTSWRRGDNFCVWKFQFLYCCDNEILFHLNHWRLIW